MFSKATRAPQGSSKAACEILSLTCQAAFQGDVQNPETAYELYYKALFTILKSSLKELPKPQRDMIYDQKNIFLTRGKVKNEKGIRGGDSRQAYLSDLEMALDVVITWVNEGANPVNLYNIFRDKNIELGYLK